MKLKYYIKSFRLRTLPLSISGIIMGAFLAVNDNCFDLQIFLFAIATTLSLQILANLSNEYGDLKKGTDNEARLGPIRSIQRGDLSMNDMKKMIYAFVFISIFFGLLLIYSAWNFISVNFIVFVVLGLLSIIASLKYTLGKNPYGYHGLGDLFVFIFFGLVSTFGCYYLMSGTLNYIVLLPAASIGLLSVAVLNVNNMRDMDNDKACNKQTIPVKIGIKNAKIYHLILIVLSFLFFTIYAVYAHKTFVYCLAIPLFAIHLKNILSGEGKILDKQMAVLSLSTLLFTVLAGVSICF